jgi:hypothetical protein
MSSSDPSGLIDKSGPDDLYMRDHPAAPDDPADRFWRWFWTGDPNADDETLQAALEGSYLWHWERNKNNDPDDATEEQPWWRNLFHSPCSTTKYLSPDGHDEAIRDSDGNLVTDPDDGGGTYNYSDPLGDPLGHFIFDMLPGMVFGNDPGTAGPPPPPPPREPTIPCFLAGTLVHSPSGLRPIEQLKAGETVWSFDLLRRQWCSREVVEVPSHEFDGIVVTVQLGHDTVSSTDHHPYWVLSGESLHSRPDVRVNDALNERVPSLGRWVSAVDLRAGDMMISRSNSIDVVKEVVREARRVTVYNLSVRDARNFCVGSSGVLCHNT